MIDWIGDSKHNSCIQPRHSWDKVLVMINSGNHNDDTYFVRIPIVKPS